jgi:hypothetical protein
MSEDSKQALKTGLTKARTAKSDKPMFFAMVLKGGSDGVLLVDKMKIAPAKIQQAKKECGGSAVVNGLCFGEEGALVFETPKEPGGTWAAAAKKMAQAAGVSIKPVFRLGRDPDSIAETPLLHDRLLSKMKVISFPNCFIATVPGLKVTNAHMSEAMAALGIRCGMCTR